MDKKITITILAMVILCSVVIYRARNTLPHKNKPNIIIINLDALRPDHLGCYGYARNTSPHIDDFARHSNLYLNCFSAATWTIPANYSLLTSLYPEQHTMYDWNSILDKKIPTMFSLLRDYGYVQGFFSNSGFLVKNFKVNFSQILNTCSNVSHAHSVTKSALSWMQRQRAPFFAWIYYLEPHRPYTPPAPHNNLYTYQEGIQLPIEKVDKDYSGGWDYIPDTVAERKIQDVNYYIAQYDGEVHYVDEEVGKLLAELKRSGLFDQSLILLTSDHGESLGEHHLYFNHIFTLFNEVIKIPLFIKMPAQRQGVIVKENVSSLDILPTVLNSIGIKDCQKCEGINLFDAFNQKRGLFAYVSRNMYCFIYDTWKLIKYPRVSDEKHGYMKIFFPEYGSQEYQLFNMEKDPGELVDLKSMSVAEFQELISQLSQKVEKIKPMSETAEFFKIAEQEAEKMRSLGYVQ
ncbi:MAG: sulfatase [Candidatus Omnitrophota bacterium]|jgi:arylsulfatase